MNDEHPEPASDSARAAERARRRAKLERVFGSVLPSTTSDERDHERGNTRTEKDYLRDRPPHHGGH